VDLGAAAPDIDGVFSVGFDVCAKTMSVQMNGELLFRAEIL
jgi:hypothetical protein